MPEIPRREHLLRLREEIFEEMAAIEQELARLRTRIERLESDHRLGAAPDAEYAELKGHHLPRAEARLVALFRNLLKLEDKIRACHEEVN
jgi:hypothetical protein